MPLHIPYIADLDFLNPDVVMTRLESQGVRHDIGCLNWKDLYPYHPLTTFTTAHSEKYLYVNFFTRCNYLRAVNFGNNSPVHEDSAALLFLQPDEGGPYWNFNFNCIGTKAAAERRSGGAVRPLSDEELAQISVLPSCGRRPFQEIEGLFTWDLLVAIPLSLIGVQYTEGHPVCMKGNFYKCASATSQPHFLSWWPVESAQPVIESLESFGDVILD